MDTTETLVTKFGGLLGNQNWGARSMENIYRGTSRIASKQ